MTETLDITTEHCTIEREGKTLIVYLNRPEAKNALSPEMLLGMYRAWRRLDEDDGLMCAILTAKGDSFCAGMDLKAAASGHRSTEEFMKVMAEVPDVHWQALLRANRPTKPLILAVEGYAVAGGTEILAGTDLRVAAEDAIFGVTEVARGLYPMAGSSIRLPRQIPYCLAAEIVLLGRHITAKEALAWGLVNRLVPKGQALAEAKKIAAQLCETGPLALRALTRSLRDLADLPEAEAIVKSDELATPVFGSEDAKEGMRAFKEKRKAVFQGK